MLLMRANPLRGQVGGGWALEIKTFLGRVKWHRAFSRVPFGPSLDFPQPPNPLPLAQVMDLPASKAICTVGCSDFDFFHILRYNHPSLTP
jgi:hypothetical protein